jgi:transcription initiation factor TFIID subunit 5
MESGQPLNKVWIDVWDTATWEKIATLEGHTQRILALAFSADGRSLVSGSMDTSAMVWAIPDREPSRRGKGGAVHGSAAGRFARRLGGAGGDHSVRAFLQRERM